MRCPSRPLPLFPALLAGLLAAAFLALLPADRAQAASHSVLMSGYAFSPATLTITAGDTVTWTNRDSAPHDVKTSSGPQQIHSPMLQKGRSWSFTFTAPGTYSYYCTVHPDMTARIVVKSAPAPTPASGADDSGHSDHTDHSGHSHNSQPQPTVRAPQPTRNTSDVGHSSHTSTKAAAPSASRAEPSEDPSSAEPSAGAPSTAAAPPAGGDSAAAQATGVQANDTRRLEPLLLLAGLVTAVAVVCLLLVGSRSATASRE